MRRTLLLAALLALCTAPGAARAQLPPDARWSTLDTEHFRVHFTDGLEPLARRAADRAERARAEIAALLVDAPAGRIDLVLSDNVDFSNGYATALPTNRVVIFAAPPSDAPELAFYDDWMDLVITHELVHIFHMDEAEGLPRLGRRIFGRAPFTFPNLFTPSWTKEGLATVLESRLTRAGRVRGTLQEMAIRTAILENRFFSIDRASGPPVSYPAGTTPYVYGAQFMEWLADRHGAEAHGRWVRAVGRRVLPYTMDETAREAYGESFTHAWGVWRDSLERSVRAREATLREAGLTPAEVLTRQGRNAGFPRWSPDGREIAFAQSDGRSENATRLVSSDGRVRTLSSRNSIGPSTWSADGSMLTAMLETVGPYRYFSELYRLGPSGSKQRLTRGARLTDPDVARSGRIVAIRNGGGTNVPVVLDSAGGEVRPLAEPLLDLNWASPRWSPDGGTIAVARWQAGGYVDIVLLDPETGRVTREITHDRAVDASPAWSPDGRYVVFSSDRSGIPNLYAFDLREGRLLQVSSVLTGALQPDVSPDGRWIAFMLYAADGYHVARMPFDPGTFRGPAPLRDEARQAGAPAAESRRNAGGESHPYSPWRTLRPAAWEPFFDSETDLGTSVGAAVSGQDMTTRHAYGAYASVFVDGGRMEGGASYLYRGLGRPVIGASLLQDWDSFRLDENGGLLLERERSASLVATWPIPRFRSYRWVSVGVGTRDRDYSVENAADSLVPLIPAEVGGAVTVGMSTVRTYDYSISAERGWVAAVGAEGRRYVDRLGTEADPRGYLRLTGRGHAYHPLALGGFARHALALRVQGGAVTGDQPPPFYLGGLGSDAFAYPLSTFVTLGSSPDLSLRGYHGATQAGDRAVSASAEYRFPIALVERGYRLLPLYLDRVSGTLWADGGAAWCVEICAETGGRFPARPDPLYSVGGELGVRAGFFFVPPLDLRFGAGFPLRAAYDADGVRRAQNPQLYFLMGRSY